MKEIEIPSLLQDLYPIHAGWAKDDHRWNFGPICSIFMRIYWVTHGYATVIMNGEEHRLSEGHFYLIPPFVTHFDRSTGPFEHYYLHILPKPHSWHKMTDHLTLPFEVTAEPLLCRVVQEFIQEHPELQLPHPSPTTYETVLDLAAASRRFFRYDVAKQCEMVSLSLLLLSSFLRNAPRRPSIKDKRIQDVVRQIDESLNQTFSIRQIAEQVSLTPERFIRLFRQQLGMTPKQYVILRKIGYAQTLLAAGDYSIKEVARLLAYESVSHFSQLFRQQVGMTPREFQLQNL